MSSFQPPEENFGPQLWVTGSITLRYTSRKDHSISLIWYNIKNPSKWVPENRLIMCRINRPLLRIRTIEIVRKIYEGCTRVILPPDLRRPLCTAICGRSSHLWLCCASRSCHNSKHCHPDRDEDPQHTEQMSSVTHAMVDNSRRLPRPLR